MNVDTLDIPREIEVVEQYDGQIHVYNRETGESYPVSNELAQEAWG